MVLALARSRVGEPLEPDAFDGARRRVSREPRLEAAHVAAALPDSALRSGRRRDDEVGALESDRVVARAKEQPLHDPAELHVRRAPGLEVGEEAPQPRVALALAAVDDDHPEVVDGLEMVLEPLGEEHERCGVHVFVRPEEVRLLDPSALEVEHAHEARHGRAGERGEDRVGERRRNLTLADAVPLDLAIERPARVAQRVLPELAQLGPVPVANRDPAEREARPLIDPPALVEEEKVHRPES